MWIRATEIMFTPAIVQPDQLRAARALLDWSLMEAGTQSRLSVAAINAAENAMPHANQLSNARRLRAAYETAGVMFRNDPESSRSVSLRLKKDAV